MKKPRYELDLRFNFDPLAKKPQLLVQAAPNFDRRDHHDPIMANSSIQKPVLGDQDQQFSTFADYCQAIAREIQVNCLCFDHLMAAETTDDLFRRLIKHGHPFLLNQLFQLPLPTFENYPHYQHSLVVAKTFLTLCEHRYLIPDQHLTESEQLAFRNRLRLAALLHDVGKIPAHYFIGDAKQARREQKTYNRQLATAILRALGCHIAHADFILQLIELMDLPYQAVMTDQFLAPGDDFYQFIVDHCQTELHFFSHTIVGFTYRYHFDLFTALWEADGSAYTAFANFYYGQKVFPAFDQQFIFVLEPHVLDLGDHDYLNDSFPLAQWRLTDIQLTEPHRSRLKEVWDFFV